MGPGTIKREPSTSAEIVWSSTDIFNKTQNGAHYLIYQGYPHDVGNQPIIGFLCGTGEDLPKCVIYNPSLSCITEEHRVGFNIKDITSRNASRYSIMITYLPGSDERVDYNAVLYVYGYYDNNYYYYCLSCY